MTVELAFARLKVDRVLANQKLCSTTSHEPSNIPFFLLPCLVMNCQALNDKEDKATPWTSSSSKRRQERTATNKKIKEQKVCYEDLSRVQESRIIDSQILPLPIGPWHIFMLDAKEFVNGKSVCLSFSSLSAA